MNHIPMKPLSRLLAARRWAWLTPFVPGLALANPTGGEVVSGDVAISNPDANTLQIDQSTNRASINWQSFSIDEAEFVVFNQPSSSSVVLNRVVGGNPSEIFGHLLANGRVFLINPSGIAFAPGAQVDVGALVASTLDISDEDFAAGNYVFAGDSQAAVVNAGAIRAADGGFVVLLGDTVQNAGLIQAQLGEVLLASGKAVTLAMSEGGLVSYQIDEAALSERAGVSNAGQLVADGGRVIMAARTAQALARTVVNNEGLVQAQSIVEGAQGEIVLAGEGGDVVNSGTLDARGTAAAPQGGSITLVSDEATRLTRTSVVDASGTGALPLGGALHVSGDSVNVRGVLNVGRGGLFLLDPADLSIGDGSECGADICEATIEGMLQQGQNVQVFATNSITLQDLSDDVLDGRGTGAYAGDGGDLVLGIGSLDGTFVRGPGEDANSGIFFADYAGDSIHLEGSLQLIGGTAYGGIHTGDLTAGDLIVDAFGDVKLGDILVKGDDETGANLMSTNGQIATGNILVDAGADSASLSVDGAYGATVGRVHVHGDQAFVHVYTGNGDIVIGTEDDLADGVNSLRVNAADGNASVYLEAGGIISPTPRGDVDVSGSIEVTASGTEAGAGLSIEAFGDAYGGGHVTVGGATRVAGSGVPAQLLVKADADVFLAGHVTVTGAGDGFSGGPLVDGTEVIGPDLIAIGPGPAASATIVSHGGGINIGTENGTADVTVTGTTGSAVLNLQANSYGYGYGSTNIFGEVDVTGGGGTGTGLGSTPRVASVYLGAGGGYYGEGSVFVRDGVTVTGTPVGWSGTSYEGSVSGNGAEVLVEVMAGDNVSVGSFHLSGKGNVELDVTAGGDINVGTTTVTASAATFDSEDAYGGGSTGTDGLARATFNAGYYSYSGGGGYYAIGALATDPSSQVSLGRTTITGPSATLEVDAGRIQVSHEGSGNAITVDAEGSQVTHLYGEGGSYTDHGGRAELSLYSSGADDGSPAVLITGPVLVQALATEADAIARIDAEGGSVQLGGDVTVEDFGGQDRALLEVDAEGSVIVDGDLRVTSRDAEAVLEIDADSNITIEGSVTVSAVDEDAELDLESKYELVVDGTVTVSTAGEGDAELRFEAKYIDLGSTVRGSATDGDVDFELESDGAASIAGDLILERTGASESGDIQVSIITGGSGPVVTAALYDSLNVGGAFRATNANGDIRMDASYYSYYAGSGTGGIHAESIFVHARRGPAIESPPEQIAQSYFQGGHVSVEDLTLTAHQGVTLRGDQNVHLDETTVSSESGVGIFAGDDLTLYASTVSGPRVDLQAGTLVPDGVVFLYGGTRIEGDRIAILASHSVHDGYGGAVIDAGDYGGFGIAAGEYISMYETEFYAGTGAAPFGGDPLLGPLLTFAGVDPLPDSPAPNAAFAARSVTIDSGKLHMTGDHLFLRADSLELGSGPADVPSDILVRYLPFTANAPIVINPLLVPDFALAPAVLPDGPALELSSSDLSVFGPNATHVFGGGTYFGNFFVEGGVEAADENFIFISNGQLFTFNDLALEDAVLSAGTVAFIQPFLLSSAQPVGNQYEPSQDDDDDKVQGAEDTLTSQEAGDDSGGIEHQTGEGECT